MRRAKKEVTKFSQSDTIDFVIAKFNGNNETVNEYERISDLQIRCAKGEFDKFPFIQAGINMEYFRLRGEMEKQGFIKVEMELKPKFSYLNDEQLKQLLPFLNKYCFKEPHSLSELKDIFQLKRTHMVITSCSLLAYLFDKLRERNLLADGWEKTVEETELFFNEKGKVITSRNISHLVRALNDGLIEKYKEIREHDALRASMHWKRVKGERSFTHRMKIILDGVKEADDLIEML